MERLLLVFCEVLVLSLLTQTSSQQCTQSPIPSSYLAFPVPFMSETVINPGVEGCDIERGTDFRCNYSVVLGDGVTAPEPPALDSMTYRRHFIAWSSDSLSPYLDFELSLAIFNSVELSFLNSPANGISLPDIAFLSVDSYSTSFSLDSTTSLPSRITGNQNLTQDDNQIRTVQIFIPPDINRNIIRIHFQFSNFHDFDWVLLSEVTLCFDTIPFSPLMFATQSAVMNPSGEDLIRGWIELTCTVSNEGSHTWVWLRDSSPINTSGVKYRVTIGDGSRTTVLRISGLDLNDAGGYECRATVSDEIRGMSDTDSVIQEVQFPETIITQPTVPGYIQNGEVTLGCELNGYQSSLSPPMWFFSNNTPITNSSKYRLRSGQGVNTVTLENGTVLTSVTVSLTISNLSEDDGGDYSCRGTRGGSSLTTLTVMMGTGPPTTPPPPTTTGPTTDSGVTGTTANGNPGIDNSNDVIITAVTVVTVVIVLTLIGILSVAGVFIYIKIRDNKMNISPTPHGNSYIEVNPKKRLTRNDIQWQLESTENGADGAEGAEPDHVYSMIDKSGQYKRESIPPIPNQEFSETDFTNMGFEEEPQYEDGELYRHPGLNAPKRRLTNSTRPKLAKITLVETQASLDSNPIYASLSVGSQVSRTLDTNPLYAASDQNSFTTGSVTSGEPVYSEALNPPLFMKSSSSLRSDEEPVYSEALNPSNFKYNALQNVDDDLRPYGPVYAAVSQDRLHKPLIVRPENIAEKSPLGDGQFGEVVLAETMGLSLKDLKLGSDTNKSVNILVAIKKLKDQADSNMRESFEKEIKFTSGLSNENIVRLVAVCEQDPKFIVLEYMENGDLFQYLNNHSLAVSDEIGENELPVSILLYMAVQIASGMKYLASLKFVHRDLASRNCLVGRDFVVKISDFGMSRNLYESLYYRVRGRAMLPIRWMATECFYGRFSEKTDVWSFGVTMWEIFTLGRFQPYEELDDQEIIQDAVRNKQRKLLSKPDPCPDEVYRVMLRCWGYDLEQRATFAELFHSLADIHSSGRY